MLSKKGFSMSENETETPPEISDETPEADTTAFETMQIPVLTPPAESCSNVISWLQLRCANCGQVILEGATVEGAGQAPRLSCDKVIAAVRQHSVNNGPGHLLCRIETVMMLHPSLVTA